MNSSISQCLLPRDDTANPEETAEGGHAQPAPSLRQPVASAENISARAVACPGNGSLPPLMSDVDLRGLGNQLAEAIRQQNLPAVNNLLNLAQHLGIDPNLCDRQGLYPLYWASAMGRAGRILKTLLDRGTNPNLCNIDLWNRKENIPLHCAAGNGSYEASKVLLEYGADPQARDGADWTALHWATLDYKIQSIMLLKCLLDHGVDINARNRMGRTPLCNAVLRNNLPAVNILLGEGADPNIPDNQGMTALDHAVFDMRTNMVDDLLAHGANPDTLGDFDSSGCSTALCMALSQHHTDDIVAMLLAYGANPNKANKQQSDVPLHLAIDKSNSTCVDMLLAHGANPNIANPSGQTALEVAVAEASPPCIIDALRKPYKPVSLKIYARNCIRATLKRPQMIPKKTRAKPLSIASQHLSLSVPLTKFVSNPLNLNEMNSSIRQYLSPRNDTANPEETAGSSLPQAVPSHPQQPVSRTENISAPAVTFPDSGSIQPSTSDLDLVKLGNKLAAATRRCDEKAVNKLLNLLEERGINPNLCDQQGYHPLYWINYQYSNILKTLLNRGIDPNITTIDPSTHEQYIPLLMAAKNSNYRICKALLDHGADPQAHDHNHWTALHWATWQVDQESVMLLKCLLDHGVDINACNSMGCTPLCNAVIRNVLPAVNILLDEGANPNIPDNDGRTPLDHAVSRGRTNMVDDLLAHGANPDTPGDNLDEIGRSSALYEALRGRRIDILDMLLAYGANPNKVSKQGDTPLHMAIEKSSPTCVDMLLAHGANPNIRNQSCQTALEAAVAKGAPVDALRKPFEPMPLKIYARNCIRKTLIRPRMTLKKTRAKPLSMKSKRLFLPASLTKFVSNPLTL